MNILLTGSEGYLGSVLSKKLLTLGHRLMSLDLGIFGNKNSTKFDLSSDNLDDLLSATSWKPDAVIHLAGISNDPACELHQDLTWKMNVLASRNLIDWSIKRGISKFIFASSASVYGVSNGYSKETDRRNPQSSYAESKVTIEDYLFEKAAILSPIILRFATLYGVSDKMRFDLAVNLMTRDAVNKGKITVNGGNQYRPFVNVADAANAVIHGLNYNNSVVTNIVSRNLTIADLAKMICDHTKCEISQLNQNLDVRNYRLDNEVMMDVFGFIPEFPNIISSVDEIVDWLSKNDYSNEKYYTIEMWKKFYKEYLNG